MSRKKSDRPHGLYEPFRHENHPRPLTRRELIGAGFLTGPAIVAGPAWLGSLLKAQAAGAATLDADINTLTQDPVCNIALNGGTMIPFICFDLAGGANLAGSEALVGLKGGPTNFLSTAGYSKLGLPGNMLPSTPSFFSTAIGIPWHSDGAILRGIQSIASTATQANVNGAVIAAMSQNDTGNNPHNPMYGIAKAGATGKLLTLVGTESTVSGGNSDAPAALIDPTLQPTKISQASDDVGLVSSSGNGPPDPDSLAILQTQTRISGGVAPATNSASFNGSSLGGVQAYTSAQNAAQDAQLKDQVRCAYVKSAYSAASSLTAAGLNPDLDTNIVGAAGSILTAQQYQDGDMKKTAAVMKLVVNGVAAAGTVTLGGFDYHDSSRASGESKNFHAGQCIGMVLEYAKRVGRPVMIYVFSDGSLSSTGMADTSTAGRNKLGWQGDNQSTAATFFLVYNPAGRPAPMSATSQQIGFYNSDGSVNSTSSPAANAVNLLVQVVVLNYLALHGKQGQFGTLLPMQGLGAASSWDALTAFGQIA